MRIVVTGTPGVGKHTIAKLLANRLNTKIIDINSLVFKHNAIIDKDYAHIVDIEKMKSIIKEELNDDCIIVGHLAHHIVENDKIDNVIVLRRSPYELENVYKERNYSKDKSKDNIISEIIGIISYECMQKFTNVLEIDCTNKSPEVIINEIIANLDKKKINTVDWLELIASKNDITRFLGE